MRIDLHITAATLTQVTDLGRQGHARHGISTNGASDQYSAQLATLLVGNSPGTPLLETTATKLSFWASTPILIAVTGAEVEVRVGESVQPQGQPLLVPADAVVSIGPVRRGLRHYVAIRGEIIVQRVLGSVAPDPILGTDGFLATSRCVALESDFVGVDHPWSRVPVYRIPHDLPSPATSTLVDVTEGPYLGEFPEARGALSADGYHVSPTSDHIGVRIAGASLRRQSGTELVSRGVPCGAIEVPPDGDMIALLRGRLVTAGYPVIAVATRVGRDVLGQLRPGAPVRFRFVDIDQAIQETHRRHASLLRVRDHVGRAFSGTGVAPPTIQYDLPTSTDRTHRRRPR